MQLLLTGKLLSHISNTKIKVIIDCIVFMLPSIVQITIIIFIILLTYTLFGIELFWNIKDYKSIDNNYNFRSFGNALVLMFDCATGQNWNGIMLSLAKADNDCTSTIQSFEDFDKNGMHGCGTWIAYPFFISFTFLFTLVAMNAFIVVVIESYLEAVSENYSIITADNFEAFLDKWSNYDPDSTGWISIEGLIYLMFTLDPPLGMYDQKLRTSLWDMYLNMNKKKKPIIVHNNLIRRLISQIDANEEYLLHKHEPLVIERRKVMLILKQLKIPVEVDSWRVNFRDVCQRMAIRAISNRNKQEFE